MVALHKPAVSAERLLVSFSQRFTPPPAVERKLTTLSGESRGGCSFLRDNWELAVSLPAGGGFASGREG